MPDDRKNFFVKLREVIDLKSEQKVKKLKSKDDFDILRTKNKKLKEEFSKNVVIKKTYKDDSELLSAMNKLRNTDISQLENGEFCHSVEKLKNMDISNLNLDKIGNFIKNLKNTFEASKKEFNENDSFTALINKTIDILGKIQTNDNVDYTNEVKKLNNILNKLKAIS